MGVTSIAVDTATGTEELRHLLIQGRDRGFLTYEEIQDRLGSNLGRNDLSHAEGDSDPVDDLVDFFAQEGIEVVPRLAANNDAPPLRLSDMPPPCSARNRNPPKRRLRPRTASRSTTASVAGCGKSAKRPCSPLRMKSASPSASNAKRKTPAPPNAPKTRLRRPIYALWSASPKSTAGAAWRFPT